MANICQCGCGQELPEGSTRAFKRGHKNKVDNLETGFTETTLESAAESVEPLEPLTLENAARDTPDDPEPADQPTVRVKAPAVRITAALRKDVEGKLAFMFALSGQMWAMGDPICGGVFLEQSPEIAKKLTPIICQSPEVVRWLTKSGNFVLYVDLFMACWPVVQIAFAHHIAKSVAENQANPNGQARQPNDYVVQ